MSLLLTEIATAMVPGAHAVLLAGRAGWHLPHHRVVPACITIVPLPPKCPELDPVEHIWQLIRDNCLSNLVFDTHDSIVNHCCGARNKLADHVHRIA